MSLNPQIPLPISVGEKSSFENFWNGDNEQLVHALQTSAVSDGATALPAVIFLYGPQNAGKSHLLYAAMREAQNADQSASYVSLAEPSFDDLGQAKALLDMVDAAGLVCVDDLPPWSGDVERERALFALFEQIRHARGRLIVASTAAPENSGLQLRDLVSRLSSGLIYPVQPLSDEGMAEAVKLRANARGMRISDDVARYLLRRISRDPLVVFALLDELDQAALREQRRITIPFLQTLSL